MGDESHSGTPARKGGKRAAPGYYLLAQAARELGIPRSTFYGYVEQGLIPREGPDKGRSEGQYLAELIDALVPVFARKEALSRAQLRAEILTVRDRIIRARPVALTDWVRRDDLPFLQYLDLQLYGGEDTVPMSITWGWWQKNPYMCRILFNAKDRKDIWGALSVLPMREETIYRLLRHEMREHDITPDDVLTYPLPPPEAEAAPATFAALTAPGQQYSCYVPSLMILPERRSYLRMLIQSFFDFWCAIYPGVQIERLYAYPTSEQGMFVIHHLFFSPRYDLGENAFELRPGRKGNPSPLIRSYQRCLQQKAEGKP